LRVVGDSPVVVGGVVDSPVVDVAGPVVGGAEEICAGVVDSPVVVGVLEIGVVEVGVVESLVVVGGVDRLVVVGVVEIGMVDSLCGVLTGVGVSVVVGVSVATAVTTGGAMASTRKVAATWVVVGLMMMIRVEVSRAPAGPAGSSPRTEPAHASRAVMTATEKPQLTTANSQDGRMPIAFAPTDATLTGCWASGVTGLCGPDAAGAVTVIAVRDRSLVFR